MYYFWRTKKKSHFKFKCTLYNFAENISIHSIKHKRKQRQKVISNVSSSPRYIIRSTQQTLIWIKKYSSISIVNRSSSFLSFFLIHPLHNSWACLSSQRRLHLALSDHTLVRHQPRPLSLLSKSIGGHFVTLSSVTLAHWLTFAPVTLVYGS